MARTALIVKTRRRKEKATKELSQGKKIQFSTRIYNRCQECGRTRSYYRKFGLCRICLRLLARSGSVPGLKKSSW